MFHPNILLLQLRVEFDRKFSEASRRFDAHTSVSLSVCPHPVSKHIDLSSSCADQWPGKGSILPAKLYSISIKSSFPSFQSLMSVNGKQSDLCCHHLSLSPAKCRSFQEPFNIIAEIQIPRLYLLLLLWLKVKRQESFSGWWRGRRDGYSRSINTHNKFPPRCRNGGQRKRQKGKWLLIIRLLYRD